MVIYFNHDMHSVIYLSGIKIPMYNALLPLKAVN